MPGTRCGSTCAAPAASRNCPSPTTELESRQPTGSGSSNASSGWTPPAVVTRAEAASAWPSPGTSPRPTTAPCMSRTPRWAGPASSCASRSPEPVRVRGWYGRRVRGKLVGMSTKPFASSADLDEKEQTLEVLADGVYALTAEGDPNVGAIEGEDFLVCFEAMATPTAARRWLARLREHTAKPVRYLVLSHYHAVRVLGASAFDAEVIIAHEG